MHIISDVIPPGVLVGFALSRCLNCGHFTRDKAALCAPCERLRPLIEARIIELTGSQAGGLNAKQICDDLALFGVSGIVTRCCLLVLLIEGRLQENKA